MALRQSWMVGRALRARRGGQLATKLNLAGWDLGRAIFSKIEARLRCVTDHEIPVLAVCVGVEAADLLRLDVARTPKRPRSLH
jgi:hypothetical protein